MTRRPFSRKDRTAIVLRATNERGQIVCEGCGMVLGKKPYEIDHILAEGLVMDKSARLTPDDGQLLGRDCCHRPKTTNDVRMIRKADRCRDKASGAFVKRSRPLPGSKRSGLRKRMNGTVERRDQ